MVFGKPALTHSQPSYLDENDSQPPPSARMDGHDSINFMNILFSLSWQIAMNGHGSFSKLKKTKKNLLRLSIRTFISSWNYK